MARSCAPYPCVSCRVDEQASPVDIPADAIVEVPLAQVHPQVRIAHHWGEWMSLTPRMVFDHEFLLVMSGRGSFRLGERTVHYEADSLILLPPFLVHQQYMLEPGRHIAVHFDWACGLPRHASPPHRRRPYAVRIVDGPPTAGIWSAVGASLRREFERVVALHGSDDPRDALEQTMAMQRIVLRLCADRRAGDDGLDVRLAPAIARIHREFHRPLFIAELAAACGLSRSRFAERFRQLTGCAPMHYLRRYRVAQARELLAVGQDDLARIADRCGFADAFHFSKVFRTLDGRSPSEYRRQAREATAPAAGVSDIP